MKKNLTIIILIFSSYFLFGQKYSLTIDSITKNHIEQLNENKKVMFERILIHRKSVDWLKRIDTTNFDYAFIVETFCYSDTTERTTERYFTRNDSIPKYLYVDGGFVDPKNVYNGFFIWYSKNVTYYYTLYPLIDHFSKLKPTQTLPYNKRQIWSHGCAVHRNSKKIFKKKRTKQLKATYQIQTMVDRTNNKIIVSIQYAPIKPIFIVHGYNQVWDW